MNSTRKRLKPRLSINHEVEDNHDRLRDAIQKGIKDIDIYRTDDEELKRSTETPISELRRRSFRPEDDRIGTMTLVDEAGVLRWESTSVVSSYSRDPRRRRRPGGNRGIVVEQLRFEQLDKSRIGHFLGNLDKKVNPRLNNNPATNLIQLTHSLELARKPVQPIENGRILLLLHGTFSHSDNLLSAFKASEAGNKLLTCALECYDQVVFYDHPTLEVSPVINAIDLEHVFRSSRATVDIICHSRGGLVARWWAEALSNSSTRLDRVVFVGSPLAGTSLAAPPKLRRAMDLLTNIFNVLRNASDVATSLAPLMVVVTGLLRVLSSASHVIGKTPIVDAAIATVPGLVGMSRVGDNAEILRLRRSNYHSGHYFAVVSDFEPEGVGWHFWRFFTRNPRARLFDFGADFVFDAPNDLVVDTLSMTDLRGPMDKPDIDADDVCDFGQNDKVHHLNYFAQQATLDFLSKKLEIKY